MEPLTSTALSAVAPAPPENVVGEEEAARAGSGGGGAAAAPAPRGDTAPETASFLDERGVGSTGEPPPYCACWGDEEEEERVIELEMIDLDPPAVYTTPAVGGEPPQAPAGAPPHSAPATATDDDRASTRGRMPITWAAASRRAAAERRRAGRVATVMLVLFMIVAMGATEVQSPKLLGVFALSVTSMLVCSAWVESGGLTALVVVGAALGSIAAVVVAVRRVD